MGWPYREREISHRSLHLQQLAIQLQASYQGGHI